MLSYRIGIIASHPIQYYAPWFRQLANEKGITSHVFYLDNQGTSQKTDIEFGKIFSWDIDLLGGYSHEFVPNAAKNPGTHHFWGLRNLGLYAAIRNFSPDALLLLGYNYYSYLELIIRRPAPLIFRGDSTLLRPAPPDWRKRIALRFIYSHFRAFLPVGEANAAYFRYFGVPDRKLFFAPHCVDIKHFSPNSQRISAAAELRASLSIPPNATVLLFSGKFITVKRPDLLLAAFLRVATEFPQAHLVFSGDGKLAASLLSALSTATQETHGLSNRVHMLPFANQSEMPIRYLLGDCLVLPSESETWGLTVNEAMHLGRPAIVSDRVGCHPDLIKHGKTGWLFHSGDESALATTLREVLSLSREELAQRGKAAQEHAASFNYNNATSGLLAAVGSLK